MRRPSEASASSTARAVAPTATCRRSTRTPATTRTSRRRSVPTPSRPTADPTGGTYVTPQLKGLWARSKRGFYHDGRHPTLGAVVDHYNGCFGLNLSAGQKSDLVEYLKSL